MSTRQLVSMILAAWGAAVLGLGAAGAFIGPPGQPPFALVAAAMMPLGVFAVAYRTSSAVRGLVLGADPRFLTAIQGWRWAGLGFISLWTHAVLPTVFALTAGFGDMAVGFAAPWMVLAVARDPAVVGTRRFALFNWFGILDLVTALSLGGLSSVLVQGSVTMAPMARLPLILIPAFLVPIFLMLHVTALLQARRTT